MNNKGRSHKILCVQDVIYVEKKAPRVSETLETVTHLIKVVGYKVNIQNQSLVYQVAQENTLRKNSEKPTQSQ